MLNSILLCLPPFFPQIVLNNLSDATGTDSDGGGGGGVGIVGPSSYPLLDRSSESPPVHINGNGTAGAYAHYFPLKHKFLRMFFSLQALRTLALPPPTARLASVPLPPSPFAASVEGGRRSGQGSRCYTGGRTLTGR